MSQRLAKLGEAVCGVHDFISKNFPCGKPASVIFWSNVADGSFQIQLPICEGHWGSTLGPGEPTLDELRQAERG